MVPCLRAARPHSSLGRVDPRVVDRTARAEFKVEPRQFEGRLLHELDGALPAQSEVYAELYLHAHSPTTAVSLYRSGTRVLGNLTELDAFARMPWTSGYVQGALKEALLALPAKEYDWFGLHRGEGKRRPRTLAESAPAEAPRADDQAIGIEPMDGQAPAEGQRQCFEYAGPLFSVMISPTLSVMEVGGARALRAIARDRARRPVEHDLAYAWAMLEGEATLEHTSGEFATLRAAAEPGLARVEVTVAQGDVVCKAEAQITLAASLLPKAGGGGAAFQGLPGYTFHKAAGELWRSRFDAERNLVVINNGHRDFVYAARGKMLKLRYICRLFAKELVLKNFIGIPPDQLLERLLELTLYTEENLR